MIQGTAKFNAIALGEFTVNFLGPTTKVSAKAAFVGTQTGHTHGWTNNEQWSPETMSKLGELRALMEADLAKIHFSDGRDLTEGGPVFGGQVPAGGLAEHLSEGEGRSI